MRRKYHIYDDDLNRGESSSGGIGSKIGYGAGFAVGVVSGLFQRLRDEVKKQINFLKSSDHPKKEKALRILNQMLGITDKVLRLLATKKIIDIYRYLASVACPTLSKAENALSALPWTAIIGAPVVAATAIIHKIIIKIQSVVNEKLKAYDNAQSESRMSRDSMFKRKNMRYRDSIRRRRVMDRVARHIKYNDGIKDIIDKLKNKINEAIANFKSLPTGRKVAVLLTKTLQILTGILAVKNVAKLGQNIKTLKAVKRRLEMVGNDPDFDREKAMAKEGGAVIAYTSIKIIVSLLGVLITTIAAKLAVAQKQVQEGEDEERVVAEAISR